MTRPAVMLRLYRERAEGTGTPAMRLARDFLGWRRSLTGLALEARQPWIPFAAKRRLERAVSKGTRVFEYGAGGSTLWFADRGATVVSVEHDPEWYERMRALVPANVTLLLREPEPFAGLRDVPSYLSTDPRYRGLWFRAYARSIDERGPFDVVFVDGRSRVSCAIHGSRALNPGGLLVLDDSERREYAEAFERIPLPFIRYPGPKPYGELFAETTIWRYDVTRTTRM